MAKTWARRYGDEGPALDQRAQAVAASLHQLSKPENLEAIVRVADLLPRFVHSLEQFAEVVDQIDLGAVAELAHAISSEEIRKGLLRIVELTPELERSLAVLPRQQATLDLLAGLNQAVADAAASPGQAGLFGVIGALGDQDVKRAAGFTIAVAKRLGRDLSTKKLGSGSP